MIQAAVSAPGRYDSAIRLGTAGLDLPCETMATAVHNAFISKCIDSSGRRANLEVTKAPDV